MKIESVPLSDVLPDPANVRLHSERNVLAIKASLARWGQQKPIVVGPDGVIVAGNGTFEAARQLGWERIDIVRTTLEGAERVAFAIADNRTAELADWDLSRLGPELRALHAESAALSEAAGFSVEEMERMVGLMEPIGDPEHDEPFHPTVHRGPAIIVKLKDASVDAQDVLARVIAAVADYGERVLVHRQIK